MQPKDDQQRLQETQGSGGEIRQGANNEDQLDKIKQNVPEGGRESHPERNEGNPPDVYKYEREERGDNA